MKTLIKYLSFFLVIALQGCGIGGYHIAIYKSSFPYSGAFRNSSGINLAYRIRFPSYKAGDTSKRPLLLYIDGSGPFPLDMAKDNLLSHFQSDGFVAAMKQKRGVKPSQGEFNKLTYEERIQDNLDFINYLTKEHPEIDSNQVFLMGHSEGARIAGVVAYRYRKTAGIIWASAGFDEDFFNYIDSIHSHHEKKLIQEIRDGNNLQGTWQSYSKMWWYQHFNHSNLPELLELTCPMIFLIGDKDDEYETLTKRYNEMLKKGKNNISLFIFPSIGHGTIAPVNQESFITTIDKWLEDI